MVGSQTVNSNPTYWEIFDPVFMRVSGVQFDKVLDPTLPYFLAECADRLKLKYV